MSNGWGNNAWQANRQDMWDHGNAWPYMIPSNTAIWNTIDPQPLDNSGFILDANHPPAATAPTEETLSGHSANQSRAQLPIQLPLFGLLINDDTVQPSSTSLPTPVPPPPRQQFLDLFDHQGTQQQANNTPAPRRPVATHQDNWLDRSATGGREEDRFGYYPDLFFAFDGLVSGDEPLYSGERQSAVGFSDPPAVLSHAYTTQLGSEMPVNSRRLPQTNVVDLTGGSTSPPDPPPSSRPQDNRKRTNESLSSSSPAPKRSRASAGEVQEVDLTDEGVSAEEKLLQAQQQEAIRSQQAAEEGKGPKRIGRRTCIICMENITDASTIPCGHFYCHECLTQALIAGEKNSERNIGTCPVCRKSTNRKKIIPISFMKKETYDKIHGRNLYRV